MDHRARDSLSVRELGAEAKTFHRLVPRIYAELKKLAHTALNRAQSGDTLNTTALVHEVYMRLASGRETRWRDKGHILAVSAMAMRQIIIDHVRRGSAGKRGGGISAIQLRDNHVAVLDREEVLIDLDSALDNLEELDPRLARVVECRFFAGLTVDETASAMGVSIRTVERTWTRARGWLRRELDGLRLEASR